MKNAINTMMKVDYAKDSERVNIANAHTPIRNINTGIVTIFNK